jgi:geranylgeranyl pyrophosphate synthase
MRATASTGLTALDEEYESLPWLRCPEVEKQAALVEAALIEASLFDEPFVSEVCTHLIRAGGKRLRPMLFLLAASFGAGDESEIVRVAAGVELIHVATLYLDDVIDQAGTRRGTTSANARWGNLSAVLAGDSLMARATGLIATAGDRVNQALSETLDRVWRGEMRETQSAYNTELEVHELFAIIHLKTGSLYEFPCRAGALVADVNPESSFSLTDYGRHLGVAFQLTDDVLDIIVDDNRLGKPAGADILEGAYTLPVIETLAGTVAGRHQLEEILTGPRPRPSELRDALRILRENGSVERSMSVAAEYASRAKAAAGRLPSGAASDSLCRLADCVIERVGHAQRRAGSG